MKSTRRNIVHASTIVVFAFVAFLNASAMAQTTSQAGPHFIHGSWVNVRDAADANARVIDQLVTNTPVNVLARHGSWCQISYGIGKTGFSSCSLLGTSALTLTQTTGQPARAFWVAPSPNRLAAYGQSLPPPAALRLEALKKTLQSGETVRYPQVPEFEAAKKLLKAGVLLNPTIEIGRRAAVNMAKEMRPYSIKPSPILPSLFRTHESVALVSEADADGLAAVAGTKVSMQPAGLPTGWYSRDGGPEIDGVTGFWDVGNASLRFSQPLVLYSVATNGLVSAAAVRKVPFEIGGEGHYCGPQYSGKSLPLIYYIETGAAPDQLEYELVRGYPTLKEGTEVLFTFTTPQTFKHQSVKIKTQSQPVNRLPNQNGEVDAAKFKELKPKVILREIDLDGDGVADVVQLETPLGFGHISVDIVRHRSWYLNINGEWFKAGDWEDQDCT